MKGELARRIDSFSDLRVLVLGEAILDTYLEGTVARVSREAPVPVVTLARRKDVPGGAANTAVNVRRLGAEVRFLSVAGDDVGRRLLARALEDAGVPIDDLLLDRGRHTIVKNRLFAASQMLVRFDEGSTDAITGATERTLVARLKRLFQAADAVVLSDYRYGIFTPAVVSALAELQRRSPRVVVADSRDLRAFKDVGVTAVKPNYPEALELLAPADFDGLERADAIAGEGERILEATGARVAAVTLDSEGAVVVERGRPPYRTYAEPKAGPWTTGAGDTFSAALALALAAGATVPEAAEIASAAAALAVGKERTSACTAEELREVTAGGGKLLDAERLSPRIRLEREQRRRIVFTNGCFDILHRGHVTLLSRAKALGDVLVVGVNSDESVRRLKGADRPVNPLDDRVNVLAALSCVDYIVPFDEDTPAVLIAAVAPDVFVKGGDYTRETLPEAELVEELGGEVCILPYVEDRSTTGVIERIRTLAATPDEP